MTITPPVIRRARSVVMLVTGIGKASLVAKALVGALDEKSLPAQIARHATWIVDHAAAGMLLNP
jgi:6-phosphogluconolactonase/glucosamine-6-phosphate isomerase/deaminase